MRFFGRDDFGRDNKGERKPLRRKMLNLRRSPARPMIREVLPDVDMAELAEAANELRQLVEISSTSQDTVGVNRVQTKIAECLASLGFHIEWHANPTGTGGDLLVATKEGQTEDYITLVAHADTVLPATEGFRISDDGLSGFGSGAIDNKGGVVVALRGLQNFLARNPSDPPKYSLRFVSSPNEELGSTGFTDLFRTFGADSAYVLGFEPALDDGSIVQSRRGNRWYHVRISGHEGHAGRSKGEHVNAAHELALKISKLHKLADHRAGLNVNVGAISGGRDKFNVICGFAEAKIDARFGDFESRDKLHDRIEKILRTPLLTSVCGTRQASVEISIADDCPPFSSSRKSRKTAELYRAIIGIIENRNIKGECAGGAGDVNYMSSDKSVVLDGLGAIGGEMHNRLEFVHLWSLVTRSRALAEFLARL